MPRLLNNAVDRRHFPETSRDCSVSDLFGALQSRIGLDERLLAFYGRLTYVLENAPKHVIEGSNDIPIVRLFALL